MNPLADRINAALPQTQCTRCGYPDCAAYALAIAAGDADINQCPPGGAEGITRLATLTGKPYQALNPVHGQEGPRQLAVIDEAWCIGCTLCLDACPTDAIVGSNKLMHTVMAPYCTGCELCIPVCPVDCISLENVTGTHSGWAAWSPAQAQEAKKRYEIHSWRRTLQKDQVQIPPEKPEDAPPSAGQDPEATRKSSLIAAALTRARTLRDKR